MAPLHVHAGRRHITDLDRVVLAGRDGVCEVLTDLLGIDIKSGDPLDVVDVVMAQTRRASAPAPCCAGRRSCSTRRPASEAAQFPTPTMATRMDIRSLLLTRRLGAGRLRGRRGAVDFLIDEGGKPIDFRSTLSRPCCCRVKVPRRDVRGAWPGCCARSPCAPRAGCGGQAGSAVGCHGRSGRRRPGVRRTGRLRKRRGRRRPATAGTCPLGGEFVHNAGTAAGEGGAPASAGPSSAISPVASMSDTDTANRRRSPGRSEHTVEALAQFVAVQWSSCRRPSTANCRTCVRLVFATVSSLPIGEDVSNRYIDWFNSKCTVEVQATCGVSRLTICEVVRLLTAHGTGSGFGLPWNLWSRWAQGNVRGSKVLGAPSKPARPARTRRTGGRGRSAQAAPGDRLQPRTPAGAGPPGARGNGRQRQLGPASGPAEGSQSTTARPWSRSARGATARTW